MLALLACRIHASPTSKHTLTGHHAIEMLDATYVLNTKQPSESDCWEQVTCAPLTLDDIVRIAQTP